MTTRWRILITVFGLAVFLYLVIDFGVDNILANVARTGWWFIPIIAIWPAMYACNALAWYTILGEKGRSGGVRFRQVYLLTVSGFSLNYVTPFVNLGGEPYRVLALKDHIGIRHSTASVILYNMVRMLSHFFFWLTAIILVVFWVPISPEFRALLGIVTLGVVGLILFFYAGHRGGVFRTLLGLTSRWKLLRPLDARLRVREEALLEVDDLIMHLYHERRGAFYGSLSLEFIARIIGSLEFLFISLAIGLSLSFWQCLYINAASSLVLNLFFFVPFELGTREGGLYFVMDSLGYPPGIGIFMGVANRVREFFWVLAGLVMVQVGGKRAGVRAVSGPLKALLFDFGGTLDTDGVHWSEKFWEAYQKFAPWVTREQFQDAYVRGERQMTPGSVSRGETLLPTLTKQVACQFRALREQGVVTDPCQEAELPTRIARACYESVLETMRGVHTLLEKLRANYRLGVVSNFYGNLSSVCSELRIQPYFDTIVDSALVGVSKPDPQIFRIALQNLQAEPNDVCVVGDSYERDIVPAKSLGCRTVWLNGKSWSTPGATEKADHVIRKLQELSSVLVSQ